MVLLSSTDQSLLCALAASSRALNLTLRLLKAPAQIITDLEESVQQVEDVVQQGFCHSEPTDLKTAVAAAHGWLKSNEPERVAPL